MAAYRYSSVVPAPLSAVWEFHASVEGLEAVTPAWFGLRVVSISDPANGTNGTRFEEGTTVDVTVAPFRVGPRVSWTSRITAVEVTDESAMFRDEMEDGPFPTWIHTHRFESVDGGTRVTDRVEYELPGPLGPLSAPVSVFFFPVFAVRHRRTRAMLS